VDELGTKRLAEIVLADRENATVEAISAVGVWYRGESQVFSGRTAGRIVLPCGDELGWNTIFYYPPSQKTFGEMSFDERLKVSMRRAPLIEAGKWLAERGADAEE
jgi:inosine/xanthosine triphosphate pyrophosphatase family protein